MITSRDMQAVEFVESFGAASLSHIAAAIYGRGSAAQRIAQRRMRELVNERMVKRYKPDTNAEFIYYTGPRPPRREDHHLQLAGLYVRLQALPGSIETWQREPDWGSLRPDAYCVYCGARRIHFTVEVERNTNVFNQAKYEDYLRTGAYKQQFKSFPMVVIVSAKPIPLQPSAIRYIVIPPTYDGIDRIIKEAC